MARIKSFTITLQKSNRAAVSSAVDAAIRRGLEICGGKAETYAKNECPVDTGRLKGSITHRTQETTELVGTNVEYAPYVEYGHHQEPGRYVPAIGKRLVASYVAGHQYLTPAMANHAGEYQQILERELSKIG